MKNHLALGLLLASTAYGADIFVTPKIESHFDRFQTTTRLSYGVEDIESSLSTNLDDFLRGKLGISMTQTRQDGGSSSMFVRGMGARHYAIYLDGIRINDPSTPDNSVNLGQISLFGVEKITVIRGNQGARNGSGHFAGSIYIQTNRENQTKISVSYGSYASKRAGVLTQLTGKKLSVGLSIEAADVEGYNLATTGSEKDGHKEKSARAKLQWKVSESLSLGLNTSYVENETDIDKYDFSSKKLNDLKNYISEYKKKDFQFNVNYLGTQVDFGQVETNRDTLLNGIVDSPFNFNSFNSKRRFISLFKEYDQFEFKLEYSHEKSATNYRELYSLGTAWRPGKWEFSGHLMKDRDELAPSLSIGHQHELHSEVAIISNLSYSHSLPTLYQITNSSNLKSEKLYGGEVGFRFVSETKQLTTNIYYNELKDQIKYETSAYKNSDKEEYYGVEFNLQGLPFTELTYTYSRSLDEKKDQLKSRPRHLGAVIFFYDFNESLKFNSELNYSSSFKDSSGNDIENYFVQNLSGQYQWKSLQLNVVVENLWDNERARVTTYKNPGRLIKGQLNYAF